MTAPHDPPSAAELVVAVREFLERDVMQATDGRVRFHVRVAVNVLGMVERELNVGAAQEGAHRQRLAELGVADDEELVAAIREGRFDADPSPLLEALGEAVAAKLAVANPSYAQRAEP
ncbi:MAG: DUF6285 domain-containing protein [Acidimicrobiia bacterium]